MIATYVLLYFQFETEKKSRIIKNPIVFIIRNNKYQDFEYLEFVVMYVNRFYEILSSISNKRFLFYIHFKIIVFKKKILTCLAEIFIDFGLTIQVTDSLNSG